MSAGAPPAERDFAAIAAAARDFGLAASGFDLAGGAAAPGLAPGIRALVLLAADGGRMWAAFTGAPEHGDGAPDPLDRWSARVVGDLAARFGAAAVLPSDGPPHPPFLQWARRAEPVWPSPLGMMVHGQRGLWSSWRGALALAAPIAAPARPDVSRPCDACAAPCRAACPVAAFSDHGYDTAACAAHLRRPEGADCLARGCRARRACPVGRDVAPQPAQAAFHMAAFLRARP